MCVCLITKGTNNISALDDDDDPKKTNHQVDVS